MDTLDKILPAIKASQIENPVVSGNNIYSLKAPAKIEETYTSGIYQVRIKQVKVYNLEDNPKLLLSFLNNGLRNVMNKLDFV